MFDRFEVVSKALGNRFVLRSHKARRPRIGSKLLPRRTTVSIRQSAYCRQNQRDRSLLKRINIHGRIYSKDEREDFIREFKESEKSLSVFCEEKKLGKSTLHRWLEKERANNGNGFSSLEIRMLQPEEGLFASVDSGSSLIRIYQVVPSSYLKELAG